MIINHDVSAELRLASSGDCLNDTKLKEINKAHACVGMQMRRNAQEYVDSME